jgi:2-succinyl-6-hydroxy-2,4-cyclohexadiene-1-carboxylate synthase
MQLNGLEFHVEVEGSGFPIVLLHGFTGSSRSWDGLREALAGRARVITVDALGHGQSAAPDDPERYSMEWTARDLAALCASLTTSDQPAVDLLGYSMGGRVALHFAIACPGRVRRLILESASPGIEDAGAREERVRSDDALADRIEREGIDAFVAEWEQQPLLQPAAHVTAAARARLHQERLRNQPRGLASSLRGLGTGRQPSLWSRLAELGVPVELIVGEDDRRYLHVNQRMQAAIPGARLHRIEHAGHTVHVDQPARFGALIEQLLTSN